MNVVVFGANGKVGRQVIAELLAANHQVTAFVHRHNTLPPNPDMRAYQGDVGNAGQVAEAIAGNDAVICTLSSWGAGRNGVLTTAMRNIIPAMHQAGITRIISLTGADARAPGDELGLLHRLSHALLGIIGGKVLRDGEAHIRLLAESGLTWTVLRSPIMTSDQQKHYMFSDRRPKPWATIPRPAVATAIAGQLDTTQMAGRAPYIRAH